jgi:hypothetical protein
MELLYVRKRKLRTTASHEHTLISRETRYSLGSAVLTESKMKLCKSCFSVWHISVVALCLIFPRGNFVESCDHGSRTHLRKGAAVNVSQPLRDERRLFLVEAISQQQSPLCASPDPTVDIIQELGLAVHTWKQKHPDRRLQSTQYTIDVIVHVIQRDSFVGAVSNDVISNGYVGHLNNAYSYTPFQFNLLSVTRTTNPLWYDCSADNEDEIKSNLYVYGNAILNLYLCDPLTAFSSTGSYGWSSLPIHAGSTHDGIILMNPNVVDGISAYQTFVHETGHFLGLFHTFQGGCDVGKWNYQNYSLSGDGVTDTPAHFQATERYNGSESCWQNVALDTCVDVPGIDPGLDPVK